LVISGALVLAAVNLLAWVVSSERGEKESLQTELKLAHAVQTSLMPKICPPVEGFDISGQSFPAKEVGGDHFDYCYLGADKAVFGISVFDVSGKGLQAAMSAVFTSGAFISEARRSESPAEIMSRLNTSVYRYTQRGHFVAFLFAMLDVEKKTMTFTNAGQMKPLLRSGSNVSWLDAIGVTFPLGMTEYATFEERTVALHPGDVLLLVTDGFTEAMNGTKEQYGMERLAEFVGKLAVGNLSPGQIVEAITNDIRTYVGGAAQHDDMTIVVVKAR
ncbi:MAG: PP2C family protein-serine/threonine phosphatase, partial [Bacteroidota bacterium]